MKHFAFAATMVAIMLTGQTDAAERPNIIFVLFDDIGWGHDRPVRPRANQYNVIHPASPLHCDAIRIRMTPQEARCIGILEVQVAFEQ